jgi:hypothetical protein
MDFTMLKVNHLPRIVCTPLGDLIFQPRRRLSSSGSPPLHLKCIEVNKKPRCLILVFRQPGYLIKTRGFPSPPLGGFGFICNVHWLARL